MIDNIINQLYYQSVLFNTEMPIWHTLSIVEPIPLVVIRC